MPLSDQQKATYVKSGGANCPYCGAMLRRSTPRLRHDDPGATEVMCCQACRRVWLDTYTFTGIEEDDE